MQRDVQSSTRALKPAHEGDVPRGSVARRKRALGLALVAILALASAGCGQKGRLQAPGATPATSPGPNVQPATPAASAPATR